MLCFLYLQGINANSNRDWVREICRQLIWFPPSYFWSYLVYLLQMKLKSLAWLWHPKSIGSIVRIWAYFATGLIQYPACHLVFVLCNSVMAWGKLQGISFQGTPKGLVCCPVDMEYDQHLQTVQEHHSLVRIIVFLLTQNLLMLIFQFRLPEQSPLFLFLSEQPDILKLFFFWLWKNDKHVFLHRHHLCCDVMNNFQNFGTTMFRTISLPKSLGSSPKHFPKISIWDPSLVIFDEKGCLSNRLFIMNGCSPRIIFRNIETNFSCASNQEGVHPLASLKEDGFVSGKKFLRKFLLVVAPQITYCVKICMFVLVRCLGITDCISLLAVLS